MPLVGRIQRLRRKAGVNPQPFSVIRRRRRGRERFHFLVRLIRELEAELLVQFGDYIDRAESRLQLKCDPADEKF